MPKYKLISHTADMGLEIFGKNYKELFTNAAFGFSSLITDLKKIKPVKIHKINLKAQNIEELFLNWLRELIFLYSAKQLIFKKFSFVKLNQIMLESIAFGEKIDLARHAIKIDIKAVTYHQFKIEKNKSGLKATVIFDV
ncbi:MAG: archease [Candidatus Omnitrophota bacterium]